ncbi:MAG: hypothetical protein OER87_03685 [Gammaproteobacteria bacterium]|nr:hypothetical protein [Gammaproteobacteria bacterium]MDH3534832.1 hypothetical protein [Gammaproteobacteria bacterium]
MSVLAHYFESAGFATVLVGFVREHIEAIKPARALWLDFPMGRPMGKPNDPEYQLKVIRAAFELFDAPSGPVLVDFPDVIPVKDGRMGYALPPELVLSTDEIGDVDALLAEVQAEIEGLRSAYEAAVAARGRTTVGASELAVEGLAPHIAAFVKGDKPKSPRKGLSPIPALKLVIEDLTAYYTEARTHRDGIDDIELLGKWFWEETKAGQLILWLEAVSLESEDKVLRQIVDMSLVTPRFWSEGPLPGTSGSGW